MPFGLPATNWMLELGAFVLRSETELMLKSRRVVPRQTSAVGLRLSISYLAGSSADLCASGGKRQLESAPHFQKQ